MNPPLSNILSPEARFLTDIVNNRHPAKTENMDLNKFLDLVKNHELAPLIFCNLKDGPEQLPPEMRSLLKSTYLFSASKNLDFWNEFLKIREAFMNDHVPLLPLKGMDTLIRFYPAFDLRSMVDIDLLIPEKQFEKAAMILSSLGYRKSLTGYKEDYWRKHQCAIAFNKQGRSVELHWGLDSKRKDQTILPGLWQRIKEKELSGQKIDIFSAEDAFFSLALHWRHYGNVLCLKQVLDAARIIKESPAFDWEYVLKESRNGKMAATVCFLLTQVSLFTQTDIPSNVFKELRLPSWQKSLIKRFLLKNTFKSDPSLKNNYLQAHLLLYDSLWQPISYLINIPHEQFCRFYGLTPYSKKADSAYRWRLAYMPLSLCFKKSSRF